MLVSKTPAEASVVCLNCRAAARAFSTSRARRQFGPEHPRWLEVPEPPQQTGPSRVDIKGILPVPRPLFQGKRGIPENRARAVEMATKDRQSQPSYGADSFLEWKAKVSAQRKQNLADGTRELRQRYDRTKARREARSERIMREHREFAFAPEREDERLTAESNNFNLDDLLHDRRIKPDRAKELAEARDRHNSRQDAKRQVRADQLHTLFTKATSFIVTNEQLDAAIEASFGTDEKPVLFTTQRHNEHEAYSIWAKGVPDNIQDMLDKSEGRVSRKNSSSKSPASERTRISEERMKRVAEAMTGGTIG